MSATETESNIDLSRFLDHFPIEGDLTLKILKGHLLLEEIMREIFIMQLPHPDSLNGNKGTSLDCHKVICLTEAITPISHTIPWVWVATKKLNNIRNDLAHQLSPSGLENKVSDLINYVNKESPEIDEIKKEMNVPGDNDLFLVIIAMCACLSSLKFAISEHTQSA